MIRITLSELIASTTPQKGVNELATKIGQIEKWTSREMDQSLEEEHFVAKRNYSRKSGTDKQSLQKRVQIIRKVRILVENAIKSILKKSGVIRKEDDKNSSNRWHFIFSPCPTTKIISVKLYSSIPEQKTGQYCNTCRLIICKLIPLNSCVGFQFFSTTTHLKKPRTDGIGK